MIRRLIHGSDSGEGGFSLAELTIVSMLLAMILGAAYMAMTMVSTVSDGLIARGQAQDKGTLALERMTRELRMARIITDPAGVEYRFSTNTATTVSFYADVDHNGYVERVTFNLAGGVLTRTVANSGSSNPPPTGFGADSAPMTLARVDPTLSTMFQYEDNQSPPHIITDPNSVSAVVITLRTVAKSGPTSATVTFPASPVDIRSFGH